VSPRWSVVIPTYNCASYTAETISSVLAQDPGPDAMEIIVVDDQSSDAIEDVVASAGRGRVEFRRNEERLGAIANFNACLGAATGEIVHLLHGDDAVEPGFYAAMDAAMQDRSIGSACCRTVYIDEAGRRATVTRSERSPSGVWVDAVRVLAVSNRIRPPGIVVRRSVYDRVGCFRADLPHAADWEMWARLAAAAPMWFEDAPLALYREHGASDTAARIVSGVDVRERVDAIAIVAGYVEPGEQRRVVRKALGYSALFAANAAQRQARARRWAAAGRQLREGARCAVLAIFPGRVLSARRPGR
jgi:glycosyltransferase involved in cell wall biosynthesis